ncbi:MAG: aspartate--tRNA ligase [Oscillospiraceae bacterium]|nr:aspartate--tRNA ligase [Oscillospiraceae bacterium]
METMGNLRRTHYSVALSEANVGEEVTVAGYVAKVRDLGAVVFCDVRDTKGVVQLNFGDDSSAELLEKAKMLRTEFVVMAKGEVVLREKANPNIPTGKIEIKVGELKILSKAETTPFEIKDDINVKDELKLKYRYLDLRRSKMHDGLIVRHKVVRAVRDYFDRNDFIEIETPVLMKSTPEGARDYVVPSRVQPGKFFALPQSPQIYKQLLMLSGYDRYVQIARCFRDEDLRADRQPEFTQIDVEMAYVDEIDVQTMNEGMVKHVFKEILGVDVQTPFPRMPYEEAMNRYGVDKPDTRFGLELVDLTDAVKEAEFVVFKSAIEGGGSVRCINAKGLADKLTRKEIDKLVEVVKTYGAKGLAYTRLTADAETSSFEKFLTAEQIAAVREKAQAEKGDVILVVASDDMDVVYASLGALRLHIAKKFELFDPEQFNFLWVTNFPLFEYDKEEQRFVAKHHPFTMPKDEDIPYIDTDPGRCCAKAYDMVLNGVELGGGSIRITNPELQHKMFKTLGFTEERISENFGFLVEAYKYGAPPHGGMAYGLDRLCMLMAHKDSIRDVIAFPKVQNSGEIMSGCPDYIEEKQMNELYIASTVETTEE